MGNNKSKNPPIRVIFTQGRSIRQVEIILFKIVCLIIQKSAHFVTKLPTRFNERAVKVFYLASEK